MRPRERVLDHRAIGGDEGGIDAAARRRRGSRRPSASADRRASVCSACQRLNCRCRACSSVERSSSVEIVVDVAPAPKSRAAPTAPGGARRRAKVSVRLGASSANTPAASSSRASRRRRRAAGRRASASTRPSATGIVIGSFSGCPGVGAERLRELDAEGLRRLVVGACAIVSSGVPAWVYQRLNVVEVAAGDFGETGEEILDRRRRAVAALEIEVHARAERLGADQRLEHADHFGALLVDRRRVEIVDLVIDLGPHVMRERPGVLGELRGLQRAHVGDALDRRRALVGGEFLIAEDGQAFLQAELEPVAAGDAVAGPVVEIFVRDDALDAGVIVVGRGRRREASTYLSLKTLRPLFSIAPILKSETATMLKTSRSYSRPIGALVPGHRALQRVHRVGGAASRGRARHRCRARRAGPRR